jgi:hypothetical protein
VRPTAQAEGRTSRPGRLHCRVDAAIPDKPTIASGRKTKVCVFRFGVIHVLPRAFRERHARGPPSHSFPSYRPMNPEAESKAAPSPKKAGRLPVEWRHTEEYPERYDVIHVLLEDGRARYATWNGTFWWGYDERLGRSCRLQVVAWAPLHAVELSGARRAER